MDASTTLSGDGQVSVLVVDDEESFLSLTETYLGRTDRLDVRSTTDPETVLDCVENEEVDCLVSDYDMPEMDGIELLTEVRQLDSTVPFILYTGRGSEDVASEAISAGVTDYLQKGGSSDVYELLSNRILNAVAETRARSRAERYETILEALNYPAYVVDEEGVFTFVNEAFAELTGYEVSEVLGSEPGLIKTAEGVELAANELGTVLSATGPETTQFDVQILTADGESIPCRDHMAVLPYEGEEFDGSVGILRNVSAEQERKETLHRFQRMVETAGEAICALDDDGHVTYANEAFLDLLGTDEENVVGKRYLDLFLWESEEDPLAELLAATPPATASFEAPLATADGERRAETTLSISESDGAQVTTAVLRDAGPADRDLGIDIGARALDQASIGITLAGPAEDDCPTLFVNEGFCEITGYEPEDVLGRNHRFLQGPATKEEPVQQVRDAIENGHSTSVEMINYRADGTPFWNRIEIEPVRDDNGEVTHYLGFQRDVTEQRLAVREASRHEQRIEQLTSDLGHDIKTPLSVAQGHLDLLREEVDDEQAETIETVSDAVERSLELVKEFRTLVETGASVHDPEHVEIQRLAEEAWSGAAPDSATLVIDGPLDDVLADPGRLRRLFENLFRNAVEHSSPDSQTASDDAVDHTGSTVTVTIGAMDDGFYVADDGPGIPEGDREAVFDAGYSSREGGHGSGLAIVEQIADAHGWQCAVTEAENGGARFEFSGIETPKQFRAEVV